MKLKALVAGVAGSFAISTAAMAADPIFIPPPAPPPPIVVAPAGFDWGGPYVGAHVMGAFVSVPPTIAGLGGQVGFNLVRGSLLFGGEFFVSVGIGALAGEIIGAVGGKAGFLLGATQRALLYGTAYFGFPIAGGAPPGILFGPGVAFGIGSSLSVFTELLPVFVLGGGGLECCFVRTGVNLHFGN